MPRLALTSASVKRLKHPATGQVEYFDKGYPGLALRVSYGGARSFVFFYRMGGDCKLRRMTLGPFRALEPGEKEPTPKLGMPLTLKGARQLWREAREDVQYGRDPALSLKREKTATDFKAVAQEWLRRDQARNRSKREVERVVNRELIPAWGHRAFADIVPRDVLDLIDGIADRGSPVMARRVLAYVHRLFKWAKGRHIVQSNPAEDLPKPGSETRRDRVLSDNELVAVWKAAEDVGWPFGDAIRLLILTGARREEIGRLRWLEIVGNEIRLEGVRTKNGEPHTIPLSVPARAIIERMPHIKGEEDFVFTITGKTSVSGWSRIKADLDDEIGIAPWRIHDLRRTVATGLQKLGTPIQVTESVLGHVSGSRAGIVGVYQRHDHADEKRKALEAWARHVEALLADRGSNPGLLRA